MAGRRPAAGIGDARAMDVAPGAAGATGHRAHARDTYARGTLRHDRIHKAGPDDWPVFLHYGAYPDATTSPFDGFNPDSHPAATFVNSFVLFFFFSVVPLLSMVSGWLFFGFRGDEPRAAMARRIRHRVGPLYVPLLVWNGVYLMAAVAAYRIWPDSVVFDALNIDLATAGAREFVNATAALTAHPIAFQFWFVRDLLLTVMISPLLWMGLRLAPVPVAALLSAVWLAGHDLWIFFRTDVLFFFHVGGLLRWRGAALAITCR